AIAFVGGLAWCFERIGDRRTAALATALIALNLGTHWRDCDESGNRMAEQFATDMLGSMPRDAVLISSAWDVGLGAATYFQETEGFRRDVLIVIPEFAQMSWYLKELERRAPDI